ncbi:helicase-related protein [Halorubrum tropicale]|uniref:Helicase SNF2 n=1 Tax=Halorubrum tropicale TaxID=1765655 RepID=A0A0M9ANA2_9EURY|nr:helicase-related protein [Halorubrum tropicale]KOX95422.1 helicase SNF2 [Halorubrum tropicale]
MYQRFDSIPPRTAPEYTRPPDDTYDTGGDLDFRRHQAINKVITKKLINRITGRGDAQKRLYGVNPKVRYFAAKLANQYDYQKEQATSTGEDEEDASNITKNISPFSTGLKIKIDPQKFEQAIKIKPSTKLFYKRFPTYQEQLDHSDIEDNTRGEEDLPEVTPGIETDGGHDTSSFSESQPLVDVYERLEPSFDPIEISPAELRNAADTGAEITEPLVEGLEGAKQEYRGKDRAIREPAADLGYNEGESVPPSALESETVFEEYLQETFPGSLKSALWEAEIRIEVDRRDDGLFAVTITMMNTHGEDYEAAVEGDEEWQTHLFDAELTVEAESPIFDPFESEKVKKRYQYNGNIYAVGQNCAAEPESNRAVTTIRTNPVPVYEQPKYVSRETVPAPFSKLADGEFEEVLGLIEKEMEVAHEQYKDIREDVLAGARDEAEEEYEEMLEEFATERERFVRGKELLLNPSNEDIRIAFKALNEAFDTLGEEYEDWRLFQIIYIVMSIPDIVAQAEPERDIDDWLGTCDMIFFPTGGGKTEAYLGLVTFTAFLDRLRGKEYGVTAMTKFPLRLLSLQQLQRIADLLCNAEAIRRDHPKMEGDKFSVGYFVGDDNTPNNLIDGDDGTNFVRLARESEEHQQKWLTVPECPFCNEDTVEVTGDLDRMRIIHQCTNPDCNEVERQDGEVAELPIYITDNEIYRYAPTFIVSTIDKIAVIGQNRRARGMLGQMKNRCPEHGYTPEEGCLVRGHNMPDEFECDRSSRSSLESVEPADPPSILIQDELHLLREEFGAFDSHYETLIQELIRQYTDGEWEMKVVAATATIEGAENQVRSLYRSEPNKFPSQGPRLRQSFYAYEDPHRLGRQMIGAVPRGIGRTRGINIVIREYARIVQDYEAEPESLYGDITEIAEDEVKGSLQFADTAVDREDELLDALDDYKVQVSYNIAKSQSDIIQRSIEGMVNRHLDAFDGPYHRLNPVSMTGETDMERVREVLGYLETDDPEEAIDVVVATSMISHGVDVDRFNFISFFGMPRHTAEYIQAYSRVGRKYTGSVFLLFNSIRARDRSHYGRFQHYHRYQDLLVEATPLERWAEFAIECTLPGVVVGILVQYYDLHHETEYEKRIYNVDGFRAAVKAGDIEKEELLEFVLRAYDVDGADEDSESEIGAQLYQEAIEDRFDDIWYRLKNADPEIRDPRNAGLKKYIGNILEGEEDSERGPMRSLRDIDEQIPVDPGLATEDLLEDFSRENE